MSSTITLTVEAIRAAAVAAMEWPENRGMAWSCIHKGYSIFTPEALAAETLGTPLNKEGIPEKDTSVVMLFSKLLAPVYGSRFVNALNNDPRDVAQHLFRIANEMEARGEWTSQ